VKKLIIATRGSKLALWQSEHIKSRLKELYPNLEVSINIYKTKGDKILDVPLAKIGGKGLFTKELEVAMLEKKAHIAVHSLKDVPTRFEDGFKLIAVTKREDPRDALLSFKYKNLQELPKNAVIGTTSLRRRMQLKKIRPDIVLKDLRGNVNTRIQKLKNNEFDAIILAKAGMNRLKIEEEGLNITPIQTDIMIPAMGQAVLGIESLDIPEIIEIIKPLNDENAHIETTIERDFVDTLQGGCQVPIGVYAKVENDTINVKAIVGMPDASKILQEEKTIKKEEYKSFGKEFADIFIAQGAKELLQKAQEMAFK